MSIGTLLEKNIFRHVNPEHYAPRKSVRGNSGQFQVPIVCMDIYDVMVASISLKVIINYTMSGRQFINGHLFINTSFTLCLATLCSINFR